MQYKYKPATLPPLNRKKCPFELAVMHGSHIRMRLCNEPTVQDGWCLAHQYVHMFLLGGADLGWIAMQINQALSVGRGVPCWEACGVRLTWERWLEAERVIAVLKMEYEYGRLEASA